MIEHFTVYFVIIYNIYKHCIIYINNSLIILIFFQAKYIASKPLVISVHLILINLYLFSEFTIFFRL